MDVWCWNAYQWIMANNQNLFFILVCPQVASAVVETYYTVLCVHSLLGHTDVTIMMDNESLYDICRRIVDIEWLLSQIIFSLKASLRFDGALNIDITEFQTNLVLYPFIHFMLSSYAPAILAKKAYHEQLSVAEVSMSVVVPSSMYVPPSLGSNDGCDVLPLFGSKDGYSVVQLSGVET